jgi:ferredoxin
MCLGVAPEIFSLDAEVKAVAAAVDESARQKAESAAVCCPAEAISIED